MNRIRIDVRFLFFFPFFSFFFFLCWGGVRGQRGWRVAITQNRFRTLSLLAVTAGCVCVGDSTNKGESMHFPQEKTKEEVGREGWGKAER